MTSGSERIALKPIGFVRTKATAEDFWTNRSTVESEVVVRDELSTGLSGIEGYSHLIILFWMHLLPQGLRRRLIAHPLQKGELSGLGVFSVRERSRPNPIGLSVVELLERRGNVLKVRGLDALDKTPVLDIKPYDYIDLKEDVRVPDWWLRAHPRSRRPRSLMGRTSSDVQFSLGSSSRVPAILPVPELRVWVDGVSWKMVKSLSAAGPNDEVYVLESPGGALPSRIVFGDGTNGAKPAAGARVAAGYISGGGGAGDRPELGPNPGIRKRKKRSRISHNPDR